MATTYDILQIPMQPTSPWWRQPIRLAGADYVLEFQFNERADTWYMDVLDQVETPIVHGIALVTARDLLAAHRTKVFNSGLLFVYDSTGAQSQPSFGGFGVTHKLLFANPQLQ